MNSTAKREGEPRVLGCQERLEGKAQIGEWKPLSREQMEELPQLPEPAPRPRLVAAPSEPASEPAERDSAPTEAGAASTEATPAAPAPRPPRPAHLEEGSARALAWDRPEDAAKIMRVMLTEGEAEQKEAKLRDVAILVLALGQEAAAETMKYLSDYEIEEIARSVAVLRDVSPAAQENALADLEKRMLAGQWTSAGGMDYARRTLERVVGPRKAKEMMDRVASTVSSGFYMLKNATPEQVAPFISHEHPQTIALILSQLVPAQASGILQLLPERMQAGVAHRIATMENITPAVLREVEELLEASLRDILGGVQDVGGPKVVADILNLTGSSTEKNVLDQMDAQDAAVGEAVRNLMFVFADIAKLTNRELQVLLPEVDDKDLVMALKGADDELMERIFGNVSDDRRALLQKEREELGPIRLSDVEPVQLRIVQQVRQLEEKGKVTIVRGESSDKFV